MIRLEPRDDALVLWLEKGKGNSLDPSFLTALADAVTTAAADPPRGLVLTAEGSAFCAGLDLIQLEDFDRSAMQGVLDALFAAVQALFTFPRPVVAALNGHAIAGGALLSLAADRRLMALGDGKWGLTEMALGLPMPASTLAVLQYSLSRRVLETLVYGGRTYRGPELVEMGIVEARVEPADLVEQAIERVVEWTSSPGVFADIKVRLHAAHVAAMQAARADDGVWLDFWFSDHTRRQVAEVRERLAGRGRA